MGNIIRVSASERMAFERMFRDIPSTAMMTTGTMTTGWRNGRGDVWVIV